MTKESRALPRSTTRPTPSLSPAKGVDILEDLRGPSPSSSTRALPPSSFFPSYVHLCDRLSGPLCDESMRNLAPPVGGVVRIAYSFASRAILGPPPFARLLRPFSFSFDPAPPHIRLWGSSLTTRKGLHARCPSFGTDDVRHQLPGSRGITRSLSA